MSAPQIPPRPSRSTLQAQPLDGAELPKVPPRPSRRTAERSQSPPNREHFPTSPFNEPPNLKPSTKKPSSGLRMTPMNAETEPKLPKRPSSVSLPTIGQEGNEYADIDTSADEATEASVQGKVVDPSNEPQQTRNVAGDLPLHAPKPSFTKDNAKQKVAPLTRTDSGQAAALGMGKPPTPSGSTDVLQKRQVSFRPPSAASNDRPSSALYEDEQGIPEIGRRVPMHPDAGDVQAPGTTPLPQSPVGIGFHNSGYSKPNRHHRRTASGREVHPPGSYGLHGHGAHSTDRFEQQWYDKHPEALEKEEGEYGPSIGTHRGEWALSSADLNKLVRDTAGKFPFHGCIGTLFAAAKSQQRKTKQLPDHQVNRLAMMHLKIMPPGSTPQVLDMRDLRQPLGYPQPHLHSVNRVSLSTPTHTKFAE